MRSKRHLIESFFNFLRKSSQKTKTLKIVEFLRNSEQKWRNLRFQSENRVSTGERTRLEKTPQKDRCKKIESKFKKKKCLLKKLLKKKKKEF